MSEQRQRVARARAAADRFVRRTAWLMLGAAIGLAAALTGSTLIQLVWPSAPLVGVVIITAALAGCLGLVPGARELEITAARTMLDPAAEFLVGQPPTWRHRVHTMAVVLGHLTSGLLAAALLFAGVPAAVLLAWQLSHAVEPIVPVPDWLPTPVAVGLSVAAAGGFLLGFWLLGPVVAQLVPLALGPTAVDRLAVAEARLVREAEHIRLARELHDGIGHALGIMSVQAAGGRRVARVDPGKAETAFAAIEQTAQSALAELDQLLGMLRADQPVRYRAVPVEDLVTAYRRSGMDLIAEIGLPAGLSPLVAATVSRVVAEGLANAQHHGGSPVRLDLRHDEGKVMITISNPIGRSRRPAGGGRGMSGIAERVGLFGGTFTARAEDGEWILTATVPRTSPAPTPRIEQRSGGGGMTG